MLVEFLKRRVVGADDSSSLAPAHLGVERVQRLDVLDGFSDTPTSPQRGTTDVLGQLGLLLDVDLVQVVQLFLAIRQQDANGPRRVIELGLDDETVDHLWLTQATLVVELRRFALNQLRAASTGVHLGRRSREADRDELRIAKGSTLGSVRLKLGVRDCDSREDGAVLIERVVQVVALTFSPSLKVLVLKNLVGALNPRVGFLRRLNLRQALVDFQNLLVERRELGQLLGAQLLFHAFKQRLRVGVDEIALICDLRTPVDVATGSQHVLKPLGHHLQVASVSLQGFVLKLGGGDDVAGQVV